MFFYLYALNLLLNRFGLNRGVPRKVDLDNRKAMDTLLSLGRRSLPVKAHAVVPWLGNYEGGYELVLHGDELQILRASRVMPLRRRTGGGYIMSGGLLVGNEVKLDRDQDGVARIEIVGLETVRRTVGPA